MTIALVIAIGIALLSLGVALVALSRNTATRLVGETLVVHTRRPDDRTIRGVLHGAYPDRWTLRDAVAILPGGIEQPLAGPQHIPIANIAFAQEIEATLGVET